MKSTLRNVLIFLGILLLLACAWYFRSIVVYILVAGVLSIMGRPLVDLICRLRIKKWYLPRPLGALITLVVIWGGIVLFFYIFIPLLTKQIAYFSTIDSGKVVQLIEEPIAKIESLLKSLNRNLAADLSLKSYFSDKVAEILNIRVIQNFLALL